MPTPPSEGRARSLGCLCALAGAALGSLAAWFGAYLCLPLPPPEASKTDKETYGVWLFLSAGHGLLAGMYGGLWAGVALDRLIGRRRERS